MTEQIPLYVGIPLAVLCIAASVFVIAIVTFLWKESRDRLQ